MYRPAGFLSCSRTTLEGYWVILYRHQWTDLGSRGSSLAPSQNERRGSKMINKLKNKKKGNRNWKDGGRGGRGDGGKKPTSVVPFDLRYNFILWVKTNMASKLFQHWRARGFVGQVSFLRHSAHMDDFHALYLERGLGSIDNLVPRVLSHKYSLKKSWERCWCQWRKKIVTCFNSMRTSRVSWTLRFLRRSTATGCPWN